MLGKAGYHLYAGITIVCWSLAYVMTKIAMAYLTGPTLAFLRYFLAFLAVAVFALIIVGMVLNNHENTNVKKKFELAENTTRIICIDAKNNKVRYFNKSNIEHQVVCTLEEFLNNFPTEEKVRFEKWIDELLSTKKNVSDYLEVDVIFEREKKSLLNLT